MTEADYALCSRELRRGLVARDIKPTEVLLVLILLDESLDASPRQPSGRVDLLKWAGNLDMRVDKLERVWNEVCALGIVDFNCAEAKFQLRPNYANWSIARGFRVPQNLRAGQELALVADRPLDDALSSLSRETVLNKAEQKVPETSAAPAGSQCFPDIESQFKLLKDAIDQNRVEQVFPEAFRIAAEKSAELANVPAEKSADPPAEKSAAQNGPVKSAFCAPAEKSSEPIASSDQNIKAKLTKAAEKSAAAWRWLQSIDSFGALRMTRCENQWKKLCSQDPDYVLNSLKHKLELDIPKKERARDPIRNRLGWIAEIARDERRL
jgi:hypothetical protein